ncbi:MAG: winged helix-turn-helix transcriptional regulator [Rhodocyclaceae bacterium]|nr:winged helix-turn-helix transcriptional regulator [Rhodocyclaceae bacterium]
MKKNRLDTIDIRILAAVQQHGRLSRSRLAEFVDPSPTPCWARLNRLKAAELGIDRDLTYIVTREIKSGPPKLARLLAPPGR